MRDLGWQCYFFSNDLPSPLFVLGRPAYLVRLQKNAVGIETFDPFTLAGVHDSYGLRATLKEVTRPREVCGKMFRGLGQVGSVDYQLR